MTTYQPADSQRAEYAQRTLSALLDYLSPFDHLHIADDGSLDQSINETMRERAEMLYIKCTISNSQRGGIGASLNLAMNYVDDLWMYITDDWVLRKELDLTVPIRLLRMGYDMVRVGATHPSLTMKTRFSQDLGWWLDILHKQGGYAFATRPFIATKDFYKKVGPFIEKTDAYVTETDYAVRVAGCDNIKLAQWGPLGGLFDHIGEECVGYKYP